MEHTPRLCLTCSAPLTYKRIDAKTCSGRCRSKVWRANKDKSVLVRFRMPMTLHTDLFLVAYARNQGINTYLNKVVADHLVNTR